MNYRDRLTETGLAIFLLHGVIEESRYAVRNYTRKHLPKDYFRRFLLDVREAGHPLSMDDVVRHHRERRPFPPRSFAVTFDDGFENNFSVAAPVLEELEIPATFYLTTRFIDENGMSWIDRIEYFLERAPAARLSFSWDAGPRTLRTADDRIKFLEYLRSRVKQDNSIDPDGLVSSVFQQCGLDEVTSSGDPLDLKMSWAQVKKMAASGLFTIGGHSHRHVNLCFLAPDELEREIAVSIRLLKEKAGIRPWHYSYPEGLEYCYSDNVIKVLRKHGIVCSPTAIDGTNDLDTGLFHLKRIMVT